MKRCTILLLVLAGCVNPHAQAELDTFRAVAPEYRAYVEADPQLGDMQRQIRLDTIETWRRRVGAER